MAARDIIQAAGGAAGATEANYIEDCFSCHLYTGTAASQTINNGIDLATKGGLVWIKARSNAAYGHFLYDTARGVQKSLSTEQTAAQTIATGSYGLNTFGTNGFTLGAPWLYENSSGETYASWTFRKQPKFFDVVTYTGDGTFSQQISHSLGCTPGMIIVKCVTSASSWAVYHNDGTTQRTLMSLNGTNASGGTSSGGMTSTYFTPGNIMDASASSPVNNGATYVAYLFAASNSGGFGPAGTDSVVACGSYTGSASDVAVTLGWEPQWILIKKTQGGTARNWLIVDNMRGLPVLPSYSAGLMPNLSSAELAGNEGVHPKSDGFTLDGSFDTVNGSGGTYIYLAIRRGPMKTPTDATKVFATDFFDTTPTNPNIITSFPVDTFCLFNRVGAAPRFADRLRGRDKYLESSSTLAEASFIDMGFDSNIGIGPGTTYNNSDYGSWNFRRAPGFFDVVCAQAVSSGNQTLNHNLSTTPELMVFKSRNAASNWHTYHTSLGLDKTIRLNVDNAVTNYSGMYPSIPTSTTFTVNVDNLGYPNYSFVAYLFATCPGVSKVFSFTGNGSSQTIDCGFTSGARFVLIKRTDSTGDWWVYDSARGIVSAADPALRLNSTAAEVTSADAIDPASSGFIVNQEATCNVNVNNATYIGLAIA